MGGLEAVAQREGPGRFRAEGFNCFQNCCVKKGTFVFLPRGAAPLLCPLVAESYSPSSPTPLHISPGGPWGDCRDPVTSLHQAPGQSWP